MSDGDYSRLLKLAQEDPEQLQKILTKLKSQVVVPHEGQKPVLESKARFKVMNCGRRWGKTVLAAKIIVSKIRKPNQMTWWVAPTYRVVKRGYAEVIRQLPDGVLAHDPPPETHFDAGRPVTLRFKNGSRMEFYSAERPEGMLGAAVDYAVLDESAIMPARIYNQIISPTLIDHKGGALLISTPRGRNWFYDLWLKGQDPQQTEWESWTFTTQDNPTLPPGEADRMAADMPRVEADQEIYAKWLAAGSQVFILDDKSVQRDAVTPSGLVEGFQNIDGYVFLGIDLARTSDWTVLYGEVERTRKNCYYERMQAVSWAEQRRRIRRAVSRILAAGAEHVTLMVDEGNAGSVIVEDLQELGYDVIGINFTTHKANMVRLLANDLEYRKAFILENGQDEFLNYSMSMSAAGRLSYAAPEGQHDDIVSAKMLAHWGCVNEGFGNMEVVSSEEPVRRFEDSDPSNPSDDEDDFSDLVDDEDLTPEEAAREIGLDFPTGLYSRRPTEDELMRHWDEMV